MTLFNLEKALAGAPVVTRDGNIAEISGNKDNCKRGYGLVGWIDGNKCCSWHSITGKFDINSNDGRDLFMASIKKTGFINIFHPVVKLEQVPDARDVRGGVYDTEDLAKTSGSHKEGYIATVPVEWEEI